MLIYLLINLGYGTGTADALTALLATPRPIDKPVQMTDLINSVAGIDKNEVVQDLKVFMRWKRPSPKHETPEFVQKLNQLNLKNQIHTMYRLMNHKNITFSDFQLTLPQILDRVWTTEGNICHFSVDKGTGTVTEIEPSITPEESEFTKLLINLPEKKALSVLQRTLSIVNQSDVSEDVNTYANRLRSNDPRYYVPLRKEQKRIFTTVASTFQFTPDKIVGCPKNLLKVWSFALYVNTPRLLP